MKISFVSIASALALGFVAITGCNLETAPPAPATTADAGTADVQQPPADTGAPTGPVCGDGRCDGDDDCARDCRDAPPQCLPGARMCSGACRDLQNNVAHCGDCGRACSAGQTCNAGTCVSPVVDAGPSCQGGNVLCGSACCNLQTDVMNCGGCGNRCSAGQTCNAGTCTNPPPPCGGANLQSDVNNCGACGNRCSSGDSCANGMCVGSAFDTYEVTATAPRTVTSIDINEYWGGAHGVANAEDPDRAGRPFTSYTYSFRVARNACVNLNALFAFPAASGLAAVYSCGIVGTGPGFTQYGQFTVRRNGSMVVMTRTVTNNRMGCNYHAADRFCPAS